VVAASLLLLAAIAIGQEGAQQQTSYQNMSPDQRAAATRAFLGLGAVPDKAAAARGEPLFQRNCAFCHGPQGRGATGPSLITSDEVLSDDHGEKLVPFLKNGRPEKGMPAFAMMSEDKLRDMAEFMHLQVEEVANRGAYRVLNILVGDRAKGQAYVDSHCLSCHKQETFAHIGSKFRLPEQLQRFWIWPARSSDHAVAVTATVTMADGATLAGRVTQMSDFCITLVDPAGKAHMIEREGGVEVRLNDPLAAHQEMIMTLKNDDMHDVTAYLDSVK
jgi:mono/diheme cytochrome c family protein